MAQKKHILKEDLYKEVIVVTERLSLQKEIANWIGDEFSNLNILATYNIVTKIVILVNSGMASVLTIEGAVKDFIGDKLIFRPLYHELSMSSVLIWKKYQSDFGIQGRFLKHLRSISVPSKS